MSVNNMMLTLELLSLCLCVVVGAQRWQERNPWSFNPQIVHGDDGSVRSDIEVRHSGEQHEFNAGVSQDLTNPKADPTWHVGTKIRFRRSPDDDQPWKANPSVLKGDDGNTAESIEAKRTGENVDVEVEDLGGSSSDHETWHVDVPPMLFELAEKETGARNKRSLQPSHGNPWEVNPSVSKGNDGNTVGRVEVKRTGENTDVNAGYGKIFRGPNRGRETWHVGATHRWRRSLQPAQNKNPWEVNPSVSKGTDGNTEGRVEVKRTGKNTDVDAGYGRVFRGPNRGRETWHVGATHRWRRSLQPTQNKNPWEVNPSVSKGNDGNTEGRVEVKRTGENTDVNASYGKVFWGPNRGRETWHVGATHRWRRSLQPTQNKNPWEVNPSVSKGNDGNTEGRVEVKRTGKNTDVDAGYGRVLRGPNRGRETWHVGATHRWRRDAPPIVPEYFNPN